MTHPPTSGFIPPTRPDTRQATWRERLEALRYVPALARLVWRTHRGLAFAMASLRIARGFVPILTFWIGKLIIDSVLEARAGRGDFGDVWRYLAMELAVVVTGEVLARASSLVESLLGDLFSNRMSVRLMQHAATLDLAQFEDPGFYDHLERARKQTVGRIALLTQLLAIGQDFITLLTIGAALVAYNPLLLLLLVVAIIPSDCVP